MRPQDGDVVRKPIPPHCFLTLLHLVMDIKYANRKVFNDQHPAQENDFMAFGSWS
jgi:hypothetical protein